MHNDEGKLFDAVFHKLLALGVAVVALAAVVWFVWAIARTSAITNDASQPPEPAGADSSMRRAPGEQPPLAATRQTAPTPLGRADETVELLLRPIAAVVATMGGWFDRLPPVLEHTAGDAAFFAGGPS